MKPHTNERSNAQGFSKMKRPQTCKAYFCFFQKAPVPSTATMWYGLLFKIFRIWLQTKGYWSGNTIFETSHKWSFECARFHTDETSTGVLSLIFFFYKKHLFHNLAQAAFNIFSDMALYESGLKRDCALWRLLQMNVRMHKVLYK